MTALALRAETAVSRDELIDALWGSDPPLSAVKLLQVQVSQLRRALRVEGEDARVVTRPAGYELRLDSEHVDVGRARQLLDHARQQLADGVAGDDAAAALGLWRGRPLEDLADGEFARDERLRVDALQREAIELAAEHDLLAGRPDAALERLERLLAGDPLHERLHGERMVALYRSGRPGGSARGLPAGQPAHAGGGRPRAGTRAACFAGGHLPPRSCPRAGRGTG